MTPPPDCRSSNVPVVIVLIVHTILRMIDARYQVFVYWLCGVIHCCCATKRSRVAYCVDSPVSVHQYQRTQAEL